MYKTVKRLARLGEDGRHWYFKCRCVLEDVYNRINPTTTTITYNRICGVTAILSPRVSVRRNIRLLGMWLRGETLPPDVYSAKRKALKAFEESGVITGPKVRAFYYNLLGDETYVTLDTWMAQALLDPWEQDWGHAQRERAYGAILRVAMEFGWTPAQVQASVWSAQYRLIRKSEPPVFTLEDVITSTPKEKSDVEEGALVEVD